MAGRRPKLQMTANRERWLVSYADFMTLLFAFFVVMYSVSQVSESKYRVLSDTLLDTFGMPHREDEPIQVGEIQRGAPIESVADSTYRDGNLDGDLVPPPADWLNALKEEVNSQMAPLAESGAANVDANEFWLEIELQSNILFASGSADVSDEAIRLFGEFATLISDGDYPVQVEGFTDNLPIATAAFPSNWELSAARATAIVKLLVENGVNPSRLSAVGYGEHRPVADNSTEQGRARNRRVVLAISKLPTDRPLLKEIIDTPALVPTPLPTSVPVNEESPAMQRLELDDGGLLFTSDPKGRGESDSNRNP